MTKIIITIIATVIVTLLAVSIPNFIKAHQTSASNAYVNSLRQIDAAKQQWALENSKTTNDTPTWMELLPYFGGVITNCYAANVAVSPAGAIFIIGRVGESSSCLVDGKRVVYP
jgi:hypothetical protein